MFRTVFVPALRTAARSACVKPSAPARGLAVLAQDEASTSRRRIPKMLLSHRAMQTSAKRQAEETPMMPFQQDIMNLLDNHPEFRDVTFAFAARMQKLLNIDVNAGQMPSPTDMLTVAQDPELREMSMKIAQILSESNINLSEDTLRSIWESISNKQ